MTERRDHRFVDPAEMASGSAAGGYTLKSYPDASDYWEDVGVHLLRAEALHSPAIGAALRLVSRGWDLGEMPASFLASIWTPEGEFDFAAWCEAPRPLTLTGGGRAGLDVLVRYLRHRGQPLELIRGPKESVEQFTEAAELPYSVVLDTVLHRLDAVTWPSQSVPIEIVAARPGDMELVQQWNHQFAVECGLPMIGTGPHVGPSGGRHFLALGPQGTAVSMAAVTRETPNSANLSYVYTPALERGRGYASGLVAEVSQRLLDRGKTFCTLFTDLENPTSNKIYRALGYRQLATFREIRVPMDHAHWTGTFDPRGSR